MNRALSPAARQQLHDDALARWLATHRDSLLRASDWAGVAGIAAAATGLLWMLAQSGPALLPWIFA